MLKLDHLAVSCGVLEEGREAVEAALGVPLQAGGKHPHFGTENLLMRLDDGIYLEVIAIDPLVTPVQQPRWFDLDAFSGAPSLTNWICATDDLEAAIAAAPKGCGTPVALRRGNLEWAMAVPADGKLPFGGGFPAMIEWGGDGRNPSHRLTPTNCALSRLVIGHPEAGALRQALGGMIRDDRIVIEFAAAPQLVAEISTPSGIRAL